MKTLITGATGFIGRVLVEKLLCRGESVRILTRDRAKIPVAWQDKVEVALGSLDNSQDLKVALNGVSTLYHLAGEINRPEFFNLVNAEGAKRIYQEAIDAGVKRALHLSSVGVIGASRKGFIDETEPCVPRNAYEISKHKGEKIALQFAKSGSLHISSVRPTIVFGEGKRGKDSLLEWLRMIQKGKFIFLGSSGAANYVYVEDVADACLHVCEKSKAGGVYHVADPASIKEFVAAAAVALGVSVPRLTLPVWAAYPLACGMQAANCLAGTPAPLTVSRVKALSSPLYFSGQKLLDTLQFNPSVGFRAGLVRTVNWYRKEGLL